MTIVGDKNSTAPTEEAVFAVAEPVATVVVASDTNEIPFADATSNNTNDGFDAVAGKKVALPTGKIGPPPSTTSGANNRSGDNCCGRRTCCCITSIVVGVVAICCALPLILFFVFTGVAINAANAATMDANDFLDDAYDYTMFNDGYSTDVITDTNGSNLGY
mmetsp:Transcript_19985/g.40913  ORF Transcript_19985/g.40913 Transcript_19985/m.40913 type:complete len:162 (+) Transcript_19985:364-849(+)|eukprot:CAMPEP_0201144150 /NCGR_PEP_ID=MMETSP0851-20130426/5911_1 /ASSEMBLY_ACC=CAM_ASM_000631 /TAXON_ID=183588 /ORGANISM="Pseudo-nitzschia fraudulenta, Strain WWA7" /LENGTH=161 /DNA_ID=CAMNT_0047418761 /DNA_START=807 /DNA_END=1292 /DNA_ORIENTATION=+